PELVIIGDSSGLKALLHIIEVGVDLTAMTYAIRTIFNLYMINKNILKAIEDGAVKVIMKKVSDGACIYELWAILRILSMYADAVKQINVLMEFEFYLLNDSKKLMEIYEEEKKYMSLSRVVHNGTTVARKAVNSILAQIYKAK
ncbi:hypothetical protein GIB67_035500, partial [Kingdonia uniflora]